MLLSHETHWHARHSQFIYINMYLYGLLATVILIYYCNTPSVSAVMIACFYRKRKHKMWYICLPIVRLMINRNDCSSSESVVYPSKSSGKQCSIRNIAVKSVNVRSDDSVKQRCGNICSCNWYGLWQSLEITHFLKRVRLNVLAV